MAYHASAPAIHADEAIFDKVSDVVRPLGQVADVLGRGATGFQVRIELPAKSHLRDHFSVAWIMFQLARPESREGAAPSFRTVSSGLLSILFVRLPRFYGRCSPGNRQHREPPSSDR